MSAIAGVSSYGMYIAGKQRPARSGATYSSINPSTGEPWAIVADARAADVDDAVSAARAAFEDGEWSTMAAAQRGRLMRRLADLLRRDAEYIGRCETNDNGKVYRETLAQAQGLGDYLDYFAGAADKLEGSVIPSGKERNFHVYTRHEPLGVVAALMAWNSPLQLLMYKLGPALAAGCTVIAKPSEHTPVSTLELARLAAEAGFPPGVINVVTGFGPESGKALVEHPGVDKVAFTGSIPVGKAVAQGAATHLARVSLELGGKSSQIVFEDADVGAAVNGAIAGVFAATGQTCIAGSRLLVHESVRDEFVERLVARASRIKLGDPLDPETEMGPIANAQQFARVEGMLKRALSDGATVLVGEAAGFEVPPGGLFHAPTILTNVRPDMEIDRDEVFGPITIVHSFSDEDEAIALANGVDMGLAAGLWTNDLRRSFRVAAKVRAGTVWVNTYRTMSYAVPFGGFGQSGIGRELGSDAIKSFTEAKSVWVELTGADRDPFVQG